jgi:hypothetical protein
MAAAPHVSRSAVNAADNKAANDKRSLTSAVRFLKLSVFIPAWHSFQPQ